MDKAPRIPLVGSYINRTTNPSQTTAKDQQFINCFPEVFVNTITGQRKPYLVKRNGSTASSDLAGVAAAQANPCVWSGSSDISSPVVLPYANTGLTSMSFWNAVTATKIGGDVATTLGCYGISETLVSGVANLVAILGDSATEALEAWYFPVGGAWTQITDADFPANLGTPETIVGSAVHMDGYMFIMTRKGNVWNSDLNSLSAWSANNFIAAQSLPDSGVGLARYKSYIVAFGKYSVEFFKNNGNPTGSPLVALGDNTTIRIGAFPYSYPDVEGANAATIFNCGDTVYWIGGDKEAGTAGVYRLNGFQAEKVSTPAIDVMIAAYGLVGICGAISYYGKTHIVFKTQGTAAGLPCFCVDSNFWWLLKFGSSEAIFAVAGGPAVGNNGVQTNYFNVVSSAKIYTTTANSTTYTDNSVAYTMTAQTENIDFGTDAVKFMPRLRVIGDTQASTSNLAVSYSDDDYANFTSAGNIDLSSAEKSIGPLGQFRRRSIKLTHAANTPCRLEAMEFQDLFVGTV